MPRQKPVRKLLEELDNEWSDLIDAIDKQRKGITMPQEDCLRGVLLSMRVSIKRWGDISGSVTSDTV